MNALLMRNVKDEFVLAFASLAKGAGASYEAFQGRDTMANSGLNELIKQKRQEVNEYKEKADKGERDIQELMDLEQKIQNMQTITPKAILNSEEQEIFSVLLSLKRKGDKQLQHYTICPQVAFSAFLHNDEKVAWYIYNKFYVDFLLVDKETSKPFCVIEYYGLGGKHGKDDGEGAQKRDMIKKEVCKKAGIGFIELKAKQEVENFKDYVCATILAEIERIEQTQTNYGG